MTERGAFMFLCTEKTESECLEKGMVGTTAANAIWTMGISPGDHIYLFNFHTGVIRGPYLASSGADCYDSGAWGGQFPMQVKILKTSLTREADSHAANAPALLKKKRRPSGDLGSAASDLLLWLQEVGKANFP